MQLEVVNPLLPAPYDIIWAGALVVTAVLVITALVQVLRSTAVGGFTALGWVLLILALPVVGAAVWFILRPRVEPVAAG